MSPTRPTISPNWLRLIAMAILAATSTLAAPTAESATIRACTAYGKRYLSVDDIAAFYGLKTTKTTEGVTLSDNSLTLSLDYDRKDISLNKTKVFLLNPTAVIGGAPQVSEIDFWMILDPLLREFPLRKHRLKTIVIDPGHGGQDIGAKGSASLEKDLTLDIARRIRAKLQSIGYKVVLTRDKDVFIPLGTRPATCAAADADLFISLHCNSAGKDIRGMEVYALAPAGARSTNGGEVAPNVAGNANNKSNVRLAYEIHKALIKSIGAQDRGVRHSQFAVLKGSTVPAALLELGFISSKYDESLLSSKNYQDSLAKAVAAGVMAYHKAMLRGQPPPIKSKTAGSAPNP